MCKHRYMLYAFQYKFHLLWLVNWIVYSYKNTTCDRFIMPQHIWLQTNNQACHFCLSKFPPDRAHFRAHVASLCERYQLTGRVADVTCVQSYSISTTPLRPRRHRHPLLSCIIYFCEPKPITYLSFLLIDYYLPLPIRQLPLRLSRITLIAGWSLHRKKVAVSLNCFD